MAHTPPGETRDKVFRYVRDRLLAGAPPTVREVQDAMGFGAVESARKQLDALVGYVEGGGGFVPVHCASACWGRSPRFVRLVGARFQSHGAWRNCCAPRIGPGGARRI